jgi:EAL domain-containing protein (putative c-di-GMP-specific phosphodiesterase class I)
LEIYAARRALRALSTLPGSVYVGINLSPPSLLDRRLYEVLAQWPARRIVFEVTEHDVVDEYDTLVAALEPLRKSGAKLAVDDAGAGFASFRHILELRPDYIKLDISLTRGIDQHPGQRALAAAITSFGNATGSTIVAEGVETEAELRTLRELGVGKAQGYFFGKPAPLDMAEQILEKSNA